MDTVNAAFSASLISKTTESVKKLFGIWDIHKVELGQKFLEIPRVHFGALKIPAPHPYSYRFGTLKCSVFCQPNLDNYWESEKTV